MARSGRSGGPTILRELPSVALLRAIPSPALVLDPELYIVDVNPAHLAVSGRERDDVVGRHVFDAFPADRSEPDSVAGQEQLRASLEEVRATRRAHRPLLHRHDVQVPGDPDRFECRFWSSVNSPILDGQGQLVGILHVVDEVTGLHEHRREHDEVVAEVEQLREALTSRATIEQAKGMLMLERGIGPDEAFASLVRRSQQANIKVRDLAASMVDSVRLRGEPPDRASTG